MTTHHKKWRLMWPNGQVRHTQMLLQRLSWKKILCRVYIHGWYVKIGTVIERLTKMVIRAKNLQWKKAEVLAQLTPTEKRNRMGLICEYGLWIENRYLNYRVMLAPNIQKGLITLENGSQNRRIGLISHCSESGKMLFGGRTQRAQLWSPPDHLQCGKWLQAKNSMWKRN